MSEPEPIEVFCSPVEWIDEPPEPSEVHQCPDCSIPIWLACSTKAQIAEAHPTSPVTYLCISCGYKRIARSGEVPHFRMPKSQELHLRKMVGDQAVDKTLAALGIEVES